jgi:transposase
MAIWAEMDDARRFASSADAVRHTGLDVSVWSSDRKRAKGHLARQDPEAGYTVRQAAYDLRKFRASTRSLKLDDHGATGCHPTPPVL